MVETLRGLVAQWRERAANRTAPYPASQSPGYGRGTRMLSGDLLQCADELAAVLAAIPSVASLNSGPDAVETIRELREYAPTARGYHVRRVMLQAAAHLESALPASPLAPSGEESNKSTKS